MAYGDVTGILDSLKYEAGTANTGSILRVSNGIVALIYRSSTDPSGVVKTYPISAVGIIGAMIDSWVFEAGSYVGSQYAQQVSPGVFITAYRDGGNHLKVITIAIAQDGTITHAAIDTLVTAISVPVNLEGFCKKPGVNLFVATWGDAAQLGHMASVTCNTNGTGIAVPDNWTFEPVKGYIPRVCHVSGSIFAISYDDAANCALGTVSVADNGVITHALIDTQSIAGVALGYHSEPLKIQDDLVVVSYKILATGQGWAASFTIDNLGNISAPIDTDMFEALTLSSSVLPYMGDAGGLSYFFVFWRESSANNAKIGTYSCNAGGVLTPLHSTAWAGNQTPFYAAEARQDVWAIMMSQSPGTNGWMRTIGIEGPTMAGGGVGSHHLRLGRRLMMG